MRLEETLAQAIAHHQAGRLAEAEAIYARLLEQNPDHPDVLNLSGVLASQRGSHDQAIALLQRAAALVSAGPVYFNLGEANRAAGRFAEAVEAYRACLKLQQPSAEVLVALALALDKLGRADEAIGLHRQATLLDPRFTAAHDELWTLLSRAARHREAAEVAQRAIVADSTRAVPHAQLGSSLAALGDLPHAVASFHRALQWRPQWAQVCASLAEVYHRMDRWPESAQYARQAVALEPQRWESYSYLAYALEQMGQLSAAADACRQVLRLRPQNARTRANFGGILLELRQFDACLAAYREAVASDPAANSIHSGMLLAMNYMGSLSDEQILQEHKQWAQVHAAPRRADPPAIDAGRDRPLRIGYLSPDLREHPIPLFVEPILTGHDRSRFRPIVYCDVKKPDHVTHRLRHAIAADDWREVGHLDDQRLADQIRTDHIDILVDLAGHTGYNRLTVFASTPAPVQVSYLGYPNTTGLPRHVMRFRLTDSLCDPPGAADCLHTEELIRMRDCFLCYRPPIDAPPVHGASARQNFAGISFGSFNAMQKLSASVIQTWSQILLRVPGSRLVLKNRTLGDAGARASIIDDFARSGIDPNRIVLIIPQATMAQHMSMYGQVDIGLDTFPYNGTTTTFDALWMGVPVVTLAGAAHRSRVGVSLLANLNLPELIAQTSEQYVQIAVELAGDAQRLNALHTTLRQRMSDSILCDTSPYIRNLEEAYLDLWQRAKTSPAATDPPPAASAAGSTPPA